MRHCVLLRIQSVVEGSPALSWADAIKKRKEESRGNTPAMEIIDELGKKDYSPLNIFSYNISKINPTPNTRTTVRIFFAEKIGDSIMVDILAN